MLRIFKDLPFVRVRTQRVPDPDAIGSALGISLILRQGFGVRDVEIRHLLPISHPQTWAMVNLLGVEMKQGPCPDEIPCPEILVDSSPGGADFEPRTNIPFMIIDHHEWDVEPWKCENGKLLIEKVGAASTLVTELCISSQINLDPATATALLVGIHSDTDSLRSSSTTSRDFAAFQHLYLQADHVRLKSIFSYPIPGHQLDLEARGIQSRMVDGSKLVACLGEVPGSHRDVLPVVADRLMRMQGIDTVVVFAFIDNHVDASIRSTDSTLDVGRFCRDIFGERFHGTAGSKPGGIGGGRTPLGIALTSDDEDDDRAAAFKELEMRLKRRMLRRLGA